MGVNIVKGVRNGAVTESWVVAATDIGIRDPPPAVLCCNLCQQGGGAKLSRGGGGGLRRVQEQQNTTSSFGKVQGRIPATHGKHPDALRQAGGWTCYPRGTLANDGHTTCLARDWLIDVCPGNSFKGWFRGGVGTRTDGDTGTTASSLSDICLFGDGSLEPDVRSTPPAEDKSSSMSEGGAGHARKLQGGLRTVGKRP